MEAERFPSATPTLRRWPLPGATWLQVTVGNLGYASIGLRSRRAKAIFRCNRRIWNNTQHSALSIQPHNARDWRNAVPAECRMLSAKCLLLSLALPDLLAVTWPAFWPSKAPIFGCWFAPRAIPATLKP